MDKIVLQVAAELKVAPRQVNTAVELLDGGATVPFIARYRKEATEGLDDIQLRELEARLAYLRELEDRREAVLKSIDEQGRLTPELRAAIEVVPTKQELEDLYLPYKPKRRTKGMIAREAGLEPLADKLFADPTLVPTAEAEAFVLKEKTEAGDDFTTVQAVLAARIDRLPEREKRVLQDASVIGKQFAEPLLATVTVILALKTVAAWAVALLLFFPLGWLLLTAFKTELQAIAQPPLLFFPPTLENFHEVQERSDYLLYATNSLVTSVVSTLLGLALAALAQALRHCAVASPGLT